MQRNRLILRADHDALHEGMRRIAARLDWQIVDELPERPEDLARLVTLESLGLREPAPLETESLGPLDAEGLPTMIDTDGETVEAPPVIEFIEGVPDDVPRQTAPMLTFGAAGGTVDEIAVIELPAPPPAERSRTKDEIPSLEEFIRAGYDPAEYDRFVAHWKSNPQQNAPTEDGWGDSS